jgi:hypothetical protein
MQLVYSHPDENLIDIASAIVVASGTPLTGYDTDQLSNGTWAHPFKIAVTTLDLRFEFAQAVLPEFVVLGNTNLTVAAVLEGRSTNVWGAAEVTYTFGVPTVGAERYPLYTSPFGDLSGLSARRFWRLRVTGNATPIILGALHLGSTYRTIDTNYDLAETELTAAFRTKRQETGYGIELAYQQASRREAIDGAVVVTLAEFAALEAWHQACAGAAEPTFMVPNDEVNDAWYVRLPDGGLRRRAYGPGGWRVQLPIRQLSRGLGW